MIGLDIGTYSIKAVEVQKENNSLSLVNYKLLKRPQQEALTTTLKKFFEGEKFTSRDVCISVSGSLVIVRLSELPEMNEEELKNAVKFEAERVLPYSIEEAVLDYKVVSENQADKKTTVLFASAKADVVKKTIEEVNKSGYNVKGVDVDGIALTNAFLEASRAKGNENQEKAVVLFNIGDTFLNMSIVYNEIPFVLRDISGAGKEFVEDITKSLGLNTEEAYQFKHFPAQDKQEALSELLRPSLTKLARETRLSIGYFENKFAKEIDKIYISGGSSKLFGLKEFLAESLDTQVESWDPFSAVNLKEGPLVDAIDDVKPELAVALGLAIRND